MDLRDRFAARFAAALVDALTDADEIARRAYDLADAMLVERSGRVVVDVDVDEEGAIAREPRRVSFFPPAPSSYHGALLDEPAPDYDEEQDLSWLDPPYDPSWDLEVRWSGDPPRQATSSRPPGPGLARTVPEAEDAGEERGEERSA